MKITNPKRFRFLISTTIVLVALLFAGALIVLVPVGEAPDEPAHLTYVDHIVRQGSLPSVARVPVGDHYESYQPPLAYVLMAITVRVAGFHEIEYQFIRDPHFRFQPGARALVEPSGDTSLDHGTRAVRTARVSNMLWLVVTEVMVLLICLRVASSFAASLATALPFCFAPQLLFSCSTANNDAAVIALSSVAVFFLFILVSGDQEQPMIAVAVSVAAGLALWAKVSAVFLVPALAIAAVVSIQTRRWQTVVALLTPGCLLSVAWVLFSLARVDSVVPLPAVALGNHPGGWVRLFAEPSWVLSVWGGFWAKMGWFNLPLPTPFYLAFLPASFAALIGFSVTCFSSRFRSPANLMLTLAVTMNVAILGAYMVRVDWQPQGRYLLSSIVAVAGLCALGQEWLCQRFKTNVSPRFAIVSGVWSLVGAVTAIVVVATNY